MTSQQGVSVTEPTVQALPPSRLLKVVRRVLSRSTGLASVLTLVFFVVAALGSGGLTGHDFAKQDYRAVLQAPSKEHLVGTDQYGRDILTRIFHGGRVSLTVGALAIGFASLVGLVLGLMVGYLGGWFDETVMRVMDALYSFPAVLLALAIAAALGPGLWNVIVALAVVNTPMFTRLVRGQTLALRDRDFVSAARSLGAGVPWIVVRHVLPNITAPVIVQLSLSISFAIITEASLSFLGLGVQPPIPSWGSMLRDGFSYMQHSPYLAFAPGVAIFLSVLALNLLGDVLRDELDPRARTVR